MDRLSALLNMSSVEKSARGLEYTPKEIAQQPSTWVTTFDHLRRRKDELFSFLSDSVLGGSIEDRPTVFLVGAGTSDFIGQSLHHLLRVKWQCEVIPVASTSLLTDLPEFLLKHKRYLWLSFSRSGDSPEGVALLERALSEYPQIAHLVVTCNASGRMSNAVAGRNDCLSIVLDDATNDRGLAMTSSFTNMVLAGQILAHLANLDDYEPQFRSLVGAAEEFIPRATELASSLADMDFKRACFVGSGVLAGTAMECALKLLELTAGRFQTMTQSTLALRHGPMAALDGETLLVSLVSSEPQRRQYEIDLLREIGTKELAGARVAVATDPDQLRTAADYVLAPGIEEPIPDLYRPILDVIFGQLLGLFASIRFGLKPDDPSPNGAISRVVQNVDIY